MRAAGWSGLRDYLRRTHRLLLALDLIRVLAIVASPILALLVFRLMAEAREPVALVHRRLFAHRTDNTEGLVYLWFLLVASATNAAWITRTIRNFAGITLSRVTGLKPDGKRATEIANVDLPAYPYSRESFTMVLAELQDRDGCRVPNATRPEARPRWLTIPERGLYTGFFVTGAIGSGKTSALAYPMLKQLLGFRRPVRVRRASGEICEEEWKFSGVVSDEKGDFTEKTAEYCRLWGRQDDLIRISPDGPWKWNVIYNPNLPTWATAYQLGWIIKNFNKGAAGSDPFWENAPKELLTEYLSLLDDALGYYTISDYLEVLISDERQDELFELARRRANDDPEHLQEVERRFRSIMKRRDGMGTNLRGSLEACARAGIDMFRFPELRRTFCPTREEYFERDPKTGLERPRANVFTGFDQILDYGKIVGLEMPKTIWFDAAIFVQVALKAQWQDAISRREAVGQDGRLLQPPRFGPRIGYCPSFLMADECQLSATPRDAEFSGLMRSRRACFIGLTQSHSSLKGAFGPTKAVEADVLLQNLMTKIYLRQSDLKSMDEIVKESGKKLVQKTTLALTGAGQSSSLSYVQGDFVHDGIGVSTTKTVATEEKPFVEVEALKTLPNNVAVILPSNGERTLPATVAYLRPDYLFAKYPDLPLERSWLDWPDELRGTHDQDRPDLVRWQGWAGVAEIAESEVVPAAARLGRFVKMAPAPPPPGASPARSAVRPSFTAGSYGDLGDIPQGLSMAFPSPESDSTEVDFKPADPPDAINPFAQDFEEAE